MPVAELRRRVSCAEFTHWAAFYRMEAAERERQAKQGQGAGKGRRR